jgi:hypothetical protein
VEHTPEAEIRLGRRWVRALALPWGSRAQNMHVLDLTLHLMH